MSGKHHGRMIVGLDIGTSKVVALVGEVGPEGEIEIVGRLIEAEANVNLQNGQGQTSLMMAAAGGYYGIVQALLDGDA